MGSMSIEFPFHRDGRLPNSPLLSNAAVIGSLTLLLTTLYPEALTDSMRSRLSNAFLIGMIVGMVGFGVVVDQLGRKTGAIATTLLLLLGIAMSAAANGTTELGVIWMLVIARGVAGVGAGGEYPVAGMYNSIASCAYDPILTPI